MHSLVLGFLNIGSSEMILIVFVALLLFGGEKLPEIARGLGKGIRDFKDASDGVKREINNQINSYEEKREEDKRVEDAIKAKQEEAVSELPAHPFTPVENTMPVSDSHFTSETHITEHTEVTAEGHEAFAHGTAADTHETHTGTTAENVHGEHHEPVTTEHTKNT
jgi:sec-independent protein translocase protein TatA